MIKTEPWDRAAWLETEEDIAERLSAAFETGEPQAVTRALATIARARGMTQMAKISGIARGSLYKAIGEGANPTLATLLALLSALDVSLSVKPKASA
jgi:probable addiction module antidote protein